MKGSRDRTAGTWIRVASKSDRGRVRTENQDAFGEHTHDDERLLVVADGMGGHLGGETASRTCIESVLEAFHGEGGDPAERLRIGIRLANERIYETGLETSKLEGMGTTCVALILESNGSAHVAWVGDSRAYRLRDGRLELLTRDHSLIAEWIQMGIVTEEQARVHPRRNELTRAVGATPDVDVETRSVDIAPRDRFLLCTDGLWGIVPEERLRAILLGTDPDDVVRELVDRANLGGGPDNATAQVAFIDADPPFLAPHSDTAPPDALPESDSPGQIIGESAREGEADRADSQREKAAASSRTGSEAAGASRPATRPSLRRLGLGRSVPALSAILGAVTAAGLITGALGVRLLLRTAPAPSAESAPGSAPGSEPADQIEEASAPSSGSKVSPAAAPAVDPAKPETVPSAEVPVPMPEPPPAAPSPPARTAEAEQPAIEASDPAPIPSSPSDALESDLDADFLVVTESEAARLGGEVVPLPDPIPTAAGFDLPEPVRRFLDDWLRALAERDSEALARLGIGGELELLGSLATRESYRLRAAEVAGGAVSEGTAHVRVVLSYAFRNREGRFRTEDELRLILVESPGGLRFRGYWQ